MDTPSSFSLELLTTYKENSLLEVKSASGSEHTSRPVYIGSDPRTGTSRHNYGGIDRTMLTLGFEGHQPDIEALKLLYDNPNELIEVSDTAGNKGESKDVPQNVPQNGMGVAQNVAQTSNNVAQNGVDVAQNVPQNLGNKIIALIKEIPNVKREEMARRLSETKL